jgi:hypothetical protein
MFGSAVPFIEIMREMWPLIVCLLSASRVMGQPGGQEISPSSSLGEAIVNPPVIGASSDPCAFVNNITGKSNFFY